VLIKKNVETKTPPFTPVYDRNALNIDELVLMSRKQTLSYENRLMHDDTSDTTIFGR
jgi:hypothetical protein